MQFHRFFEELKRRNVFKVATAYAIASWLIIQVIATVSPQLSFPEWVPSFFTLLVLIGFPLALIFAWAFELTPEGLQKSNQVEITESVTSSTGKKLNGIIITVLSMGVIFLLVERVFFAKASILEDAQTLANIETASIAVLPFVNMSGDEENEYFSDGLSEELLNALAKVEDMKVAGRTSSFKFKGQNEDLKLVGDQLGVNHILEGSVRKAGGRVRITAQLIKVDDGFHMWSETFDRELTATNIFEIQEEISRKVLGELKVRLLPEEEQQLENIPTRDIEAYQAYLKGSQLLLNRNYDEIEASIALYQDAIRIDPTFASAYAQLAIAYNLQGYYGNIPSETVLENMKPNIDRALSINNDLPEGHAALGLYYDNSNDIENAVTAFERSIELNPNQADVYNWLGNAHQSLGDRKAQMEWYKKGYENDPLNPLAVYNRIRVSVENEDYEEMEFFMDKNIRINPDFIPTYFLKGNIQFGAPLGRLDEAGKYFTQVYNSDNDFPRAMSLLIVTAQVLDIPKMADYYYELLKENYRESFEYRFSIGFYESNKGEYLDYPSIQLPFLEESEFVPQDEFSYFDLSDYALRTGNFDQVFPLFEKFDPGMFDDTLSVITSRNKGQASTLAYLLKRNGENEQAARITEAFCAFTERSKETYKTGEEDVRYQQDVTNCLFLRGEIEEYREKIEALYKEHRSIVTVYVWLRNVKLFEPEVYNSELETIHMELLNELSEQKINLIEYLKAEGEWQDEWEVGN